MADALGSATHDAVTEVLQANEALLMAMVGLVRYSRLDPETGEAYDAFALITGDGLSPIDMAGLVATLDTITGQALRGMTAD